MEKCVGFPGRTFSCLCLSGNHMHIYTRCWTLSGLGYWTLGICCHILYKQTFIKLINYFSQHSTNYPCEPCSWCVFASFNLCVFVKRISSLWVQRFVFSRFIFKPVGRVSISVRRKVLSVRSKRWSAEQKSSLNITSPPSIFVFPFHRFSEHDY